MRNPHLAPRGTFTAVLVGGLASGAIDICYAVLAHRAQGISPRAIFQSVAAGLLGRSAYHAGLASAALGLLLHFLMTCLIALVFVLAAKRFTFLRDQYVPVGLAYGIAIYFVMRWIVAPLSRFPNDLRVVRPVELLVHMVGVGLVIAASARFLGEARQGASQRCRCRP